MTQSIVTPGNIAVTITSSQAIDAVQLPWP